MDKGKIFCSNCGSGRVEKKMPSDKPRYRCRNCGWTFETLADNEVKKEEKINVGNKFMMMI